MPNPFPGMNPYLEETASWRDVHTTLLAYIREALQPQLVPGYVARIEETIEIDDSPHQWVPDVTIVGERGNDNEAQRAAGMATLARPLVLEMSEERTERWLEILDVRGREVVTVIELLSPSNKSASGYGNRKYSLKLRDCLNSSVNIVEVDLLRGGVPATAAEIEPNVTVPPHDYLVSVSRGSNRRRFEVYPFSLRESVPPVAIPLRPNDADVILDLAPIINRTYETGAYDRLIDYRASPPLPPLSEGDLQWLDGLLQEKRLRPREAQIGIEENTV